MYCLEHFTTTKQALLFIKSLLRSTNRIVFDYHCEIRHSSEKGVTSAYCIDADLVFNTLRVCSTLYIFFVNFPRYLQTFYINYHISCNVIKRFLYRTFLKTTLVIYCTLSNCAWKFWVKTKYRQPSPVCIIIFLSFYRAGPYRLQRKWERIRKCELSSRGLWKSLPKGNLETLRVMRVFLSKSFRKMLISA